MNHLKEIGICWGGCLATVGLDLAKANLVITAIVGIVTICYTTFKCIEMAYKGCIKLQEWSQNARKWFKKHK